MPRRLLPLLLLSLATASGCAGQPSRELIAQNIAAAPAAAIAGEHEIFIATTRAKSTDPRVAFTGNRAEGLAFAKVDMTVPSVHVVGAVERPQSTVTVDPARYFTARSLSLYPQPKSFRDALAADIAERGGRALVFVHGYNTAFDNAVYRATQITHDAAYPGTPVLFTWASAGRAVDYVYDNNSATAARDRLVETLRLVASSGATRVDVVAHSMGNWVTMEALRQLAITGDRDLGGKLGEVVLASPDIDVDVFKSQLRDYGVPDRPFFVLTSANDRALEISGLIAGNRPRVGDYGDAKDLASYGIIVADLSEARAGDGFNHNKFADNPVLVKLLGARLADADGLGTTETQITTNIGKLAEGLGQTVTSAAQIVVTTPGEVLRIAVGQ